MRALFNRRYSRHARRPERRFIPGETALQGANVLEARVSAAIFVEAADSVGWFWYADCDATNHHVQTARTDPGLGLFSGYGFYQDQTSYVGGPYYAPNDWIVNTYLTPQSASGDQYGSSNGTVANGVGTEEQWAFSMFANVTAYQLNGQFQYDVGNDNYLDYIVTDQTTGLQTSATMYGYASFTVPATQALKGAGATGSIGIVDQSSFSLTAKDGNNNIISVTWSPAGSRLEAIYTDTNGVGHDDVITNASGSYTFDFEATISSMQLSWNAEDSFVFYGNSQASQQNPDTLTDQWGFTFGISTSDTIIGGA